MIRTRQRPVCGASQTFPDEETGHPSPCFCTLYPDHRLDQHYDRKRGHWWPRLDTPTLPPPDGPATAPMDDPLF